MGTTLGIVLPVFTLILIGYLAGKTRLFPDDSVKGLNAFVFFFAVPALLFRSLAKLENSGDGASGAVDPSILLAYYPPALLVFVAAYVIARRVRNHPPDTAAIFGATSTYGNSVLLGIPLVLTTWGDAGVVPVMLIVSIHTLILVALPTVMIEWHRSQSAEDGGGVRASVMAALKGLFTNPIIVALATGGLWWVSGLGLNPVVDRTLSLIGQAAAPVALFTLGASLTRYRTGGAFRDVSIMMALKLLALPAAVWLMAGPILGLDTMTVGIAVLIAAMPSGANTFILAQRYETLVARTATTVLISTALAWITAAAIIAVFAA